MIDWTDSFPIESADGTQLRLYTAGYPKGFLLLCIHGILQSAHSWVPFLHDVDMDRYHVVAMDLRGHGQSDKPLTCDAYHSTRLWAEDIATILRVNEWYAPVLIGWSYGGAVIGSHLTHYPSHSLRGLVLYGSTATFDDRLNDTALLPYIPVLLNEQQEQDACRVFAQMATAEPLDDALLAQMVATNGFVPLPVREALFSFRHDYIQHYQQVQVPSLVLHGYVDMIVPFHHGQQLADTIPHAQFVGFPGVGHMPFVESAHAAHVLNEWLACL